MEKLQDLRSRAEAFLSFQDLGPYYELRARVEDLIASQDLGRCRPYFDLARDHYVFTLLGLWLLYRVWVVIYRLYFHPLRNFPGPKLGAISTWYEFYHDYLRNGGGGNLHKHVLDLHDQYGEIFRLGPNKLRVNNLEAYSKIHAVGTKFNLSTFYDGLQLPKSAGCQKDNKVHRARRAPMNPLFTKSKVKMLHPFIQSKVKILLDRINKNCEKTGADGKVALDTHHEIQAVASDIIMEFSYGRTYNVLGQEDLHHPMIQAMDAAIESFPIGKYVPWVGAVIKSLPDSWNEALIPGSTQFDKAGRELRKELVALFEKKKAGTYKKNPNGPITVFGELLEDYDDVDALLQDATLMYSGGVDTITFFMATSLYNLGKNKDIQKRLFEELRSVWPNKNEMPDLAVLEKLPYLTAFIKEARRLSYGVVGANPRVCPPGGTELAGKFIPGGTVCETAAYSIHHNPAFTDSYTFKPERWLDPSSISLEKYIVNFSSGSRICVGMHLALLEIYTLLPWILRSFEVGLGDVLEKEGLRWDDRWLPLRRQERWDVILKQRDD